MYKKKILGSGSGYYEKRKGLGLCVYCEAPPIVGAVCLSCWFKITAVNHLGSRKYGPAIQEIWNKQEGRCIYTRILLIPGPRGSSKGNASLDHKIPINKGGTNDLTNLQWTTDSINRMKTDMSEEEFFRTCEIILEVRSGKNPAISPLDMTST